MAKKIITTDGNGAASLVAYQYSDLSAIYPITPSTPMAENVDEWSSKGDKNLFGQVVKVTEMQSEAGAAGAVHGSLSSGTLTSTFTASQGLLLMIPNMYKIAGELLPCVFHVSARAIAAHALSIFGDHQDVMACRQTGFAMIAGGSVQEAHDMALVAHIATLESSVPFINFFDGFRTSHEIQKIEVLDQEDYRGLLPMDKVIEFRKRGLNPEHPITKGTAQNPDVYFQGREAANKYYNKVTDIVVETMKKVEKVTGRAYSPFDYYGAPDATDVVIAMGSVTEALEETVDYLNNKGEKVGIIKVHLFRPFAQNLLLDAIPKSVKKIAVLDRTKEPGAMGEPLYQEVRSALYNSEMTPQIIGGRYGLGSKDVNPAHLLGVFNNLKGECKNNFTIGIDDDVTFTSLEMGENINTIPLDTKSCKFWGLGSDGTVGANKSAIKIIGDNTDLNVQAYFAYDSKKSGGVTMSHLRFGKSKIKATYLIDKASFISCSQKAYVNQYDLVGELTNGGTFLLNAPWSPEEVESKLPNRVKRILSERKGKMFVVDADSVAKEVGLGKRTNMVMQAAFFKLSNVIPFEEAINLLKDSIKKTYGKKGDHIVDMNNKAVDQTISSLKEVEVKPEWANLEVEAATDEKKPAFIKDVCDVMNNQLGDNLKVSVFNGKEDGHFPMGTSAYEKRGIANDVPHWIKDKCIQCNQCSFVCPHAAIRPFLLDDNEAKGMDNVLDAKLSNKELEYKYKIQVSPLDCTGCENCVHTCPVAALEMSPLEKELPEQDNFNFMVNDVKSKEKEIDTTNVKNSQFATPYLEFSGACAGCGETPYLKTVTQLFGEQMVISNATGCSSIWGASAPSTPFCTNAEGKGPAWANSLFEDNAEHGLGIKQGIDHLRENLAMKIEQLKNLNLDSELNEAIDTWFETYTDTVPSKHASKTLRVLLDKHVNGSASDLVKSIIENEDYLSKKSMWVVGGDGWAYDIGYGGLDHVLSSGDDINILVFDTEIYSNTGGQASKSTPMGAVAKFAAGGKLIKKKNLGLMQMMYGSAYIAQVAMGANRNQFINAVKEAESHKGPSLIICYAPCISHGIKGGLLDTQKKEKDAVESGYWHLFRYNPNKKESGENPFTLDSKEPTKSFNDFIMDEVRYSSIYKKNPELATRLFTEAEKNAKELYNVYKSLGEGKIIF